MPGKTTFPGGVQTMSTEVCPGHVLGMSVILFGVGHRSLVQGVLTLTSGKASDPRGNGADGGSAAMLKRDPSLSAERMNCCSSH